MPDNSTNKSRHFFVKEKSHFAFAFNPCQLTAQILHQFPCSLLQFEYHNFPSYVNLIFKYKKQPSRGGLSVIIPLPKKSWLSVWDQNHETCSKYGLSETS